MDSDEPKPALIALILEVVSSRGPVERAASALAAGGETAVGALSAVMDHALEVLEQLSVSSPRSLGRRCLR